MIDKTPASFWRTPGRLEMLFFAIHPVGLGCWLVRIPDVQMNLGLDKAQLATAFLGFPLGTFLTLAVANKVFSRIGLGKAWLIGHAMLYVGLPALGFVTNQLGLFVAMMWMGVSLLWVQMAMNIQVDRVERDSDVFVMSRCHGFFMAGILVGSLVGVVSAATSLGPGLALGLCSLVMLPLGIGVIGLSSPRSLPATNLRRGPGWPPRGFGIVALFLLGNTIAEGAIANWSTIHLLEVIGSHSVYAGLGFTVFTLMLGAGRLCGDHLKHWLGAVTAARLFCGIALMAVGLVSWAPNPTVLVVGFAMLGFGIALAFPYAMTAAAALSKEAIANAAWLSFTAMMGFQFGPVLLGYVAEATSLRVAFLLLIPLLAVSLFATGSLMAKQKVAQVVAVK